MSHRSFVLIFLTALGSGCVTPPANETAAMLQGVQHENTFVFIGNQIIVPECLIDNGAVVSFLDSDSVWSEASAVVEGGGVERGAGPARSMAFEAGAGAGDQPDSSPRAVQACLSHFVGSSFGLGRHTANKCWRMTY